MRTETDTRAWFIVSREVKDWFRRFSQIKPLNNTTLSGDNKIVFKERMPLATL